MPVPSYLIEINYPSKKANLTFYTRFIDIFSIISGPSYRIENILVIFGNRAILFFNRINKNRKTILFTIKIFKTIIHSTFCRINRFLLFRLDWLRRLEILEWDRRFVRIKSGPLWPITNRWAILTPFNCAKPVNDTKDWKIYL